MAKDVEKIEREKTKASGIFTMQYVTHYRVQTDNNTWLQIKATTTTTTAADIDLPARKAAQQSYQVNVIECTRK